MGMAKDIKLLLIYLSRSINIERWLISGAKINKYYPFGGLSAGAGRHGDFGNI